MHTLTAPFAPFVLGLPRTLGRLEKPYRGIVILTLPTRRAQHEEPGALWQRSTVPVAVLQRVQYYTVQLEAM